ncbi:hypothetical protein [Paenibacillus sp. FSL M7-1046]|uniref:hypothetical protein n=1 Tax=Paenibacillus sp. FSL M7-1046 TaxID=2975315 RepID=UPI0030F9A540
MVKRIVTVLLCWLMVLSVFPEAFPGTAKVNALDTNIIQYADVIIPAWSDTLSYSDDEYGIIRNGTLILDASETTITNITFNKITKEFNYKILPAQYRARRTNISRDMYIGNQVQFGMYMGIRDDLPDYPWHNPVDEMHFRTDQDYLPEKNPPEQNEREVDTMVDILHDSHETFKEYEAEYPGVQKRIVNPPTQMEVTVILQNYVADYNHSRTFRISKIMNFDLVVNSTPTLSLTTPSGQTLQNDAGKSLLNVEGYVQDADNNDVTISVEIPNVLYKKIIVPKAHNTKAFSIPIDVLEDAIPPGDYTVIVKAVDPSNASASASMSFKVRQRLKRSAFVLINSQIQNSTSYSDYEGDAKYAERFKYQHNPDYFDNSMGLLADSGAWRNSPYDSFPFTGYYVVTYQPKDTPTADNRFSEYRMWGSDNFTKLSFQVHRKPIALFTAKLVGGALQITDSSYDSDHISRVDKGLTQRQWQYKKGDEELWKDGTPSGTLSSTENYVIRLRVRDIDGENALGVWSDWCVRTVGTAGGNLPPVALFTVEPSTVSYRKATTVADKSFDPDNDPLDTYQWSVVKNGSQTVWSYTGGANTPPNIASYGVGSYQLTLKVRDNRGLWSEPYSQSVTVMNHPPIADFNMPSEVYRDTVIALENLTPDPDKDGDSLSYVWKTANREGPYYAVGTNRNQTVVMQNLINANSLSPKQSISDRWEMKLTASDGSLSSTVSRAFTVLNHIPTAKIIGKAQVYQDDTLTFNSADVDEDTADQHTLRYYWNVTDSSGQMKSYTTPNIEVSFPETGTYRFEHWAIDQIGAKSNIATLEVSVIPNLPPSLTLTTPVGTAASPSVIDAQLLGDPLVKWTYSDPENDAQEKYLLEFYDKDGSLVKTIQNNDPAGTLRQYQIPNPTFERFVYFYLYGRAYSKGSWSEISNEKAFIIDNPPQPGFTLLTDTGRNATQVPIYRTDIVNIQDKATDPDIVKGDSISHKYYLKPAGGTESLASAQGNFSKQFTTNGTFTLRQVVTDSLGLYRELSQSITVANRLPTVNITYPTSSSQASPTVVNTLTPIMKWEYQDEDGDLQQRYKVRIINLTTGAVTVQSGEQTTSAKQWQIPAGSLAENQKYAVEVEAYDGFAWSSVSPRKYFMVNLLTVKGGVQHTGEWNKNRQAYNLKKSGNAESPRGYNIFWAGESFVLEAKATGMPDTVDVTMTGGYTVRLNPVNSDRTLWTGELYDPAFEKLPAGPVAFTFTAKNEFNTKTDTVTVTIMGEWTEYFQSHRIK